MSILKNLEKRDLFSTIYGVVKWLLKYDFNQSLELPNPVSNFEKTLDRVESGSKRWPIFSKLEVYKEPNSYGEEDNVGSRKVLITRKYGSSGEGFEHRNLRNGCQTILKALGLIMWKENGLNIHSFLAM